MAKTCVMIIITQHMWSTLLENHIHSLMKPNTLRPSIFVSILTTLRPRESARILGILCHVQCHIISRLVRNVRLRRCSFRDAVLGVEAVRKCLAVFICGVLGKHVAVGGALEGLKAGLALDGKGGHVLHKVRRCVDYSMYGRFTDFNWLFATPVPGFAALRSRFCCALRSCQLRTFRS
jgi:hypothetical protein